VIESFHSQDFVQCECGEIAVDGGEALRCLAKDFSNFLRVDDKGNEIEVKVKGKFEEKSDWPPQISTKEELIYTLDSMRANIENLPPHVMQSPISHYDFVSLLMVLSAIFRLDCNDKS
jgi:hypothetical protein